MATKQSTIEFLLDQLPSLSLRTQRMFGEYALYLDQKVVGFVCDDQLFLKPTETGRAHIGEVEEGFPYPGAKPYFLISGDAWEDSEWLTELFRVTADELPLPKPKKKKIQKP